MAVSNNIIDILATKIIYWHANKICKKTSKTEKLNIR